jgi:hypothetical protein
MSQFWVQKIGQCTFNSELQRNTFGTYDKIIEAEVLLDSIKGKIGRKMVSI